MGVPGLVFIQCKFSDGEASTKLTVKMVTSALDKLLEERDVLFFNSSQTKAQSKNMGNKLGNQIAQLGVLEDHVVLCFSVLRGLEPNMSIFKERVKEFAEDRKFRGTIVVANGRNGGAALYGPVFGQLALVHSSGPQ
jgi:hypothetical protein